MSEEGIARLFTCYLGPLEIYTHWDGEYWRYGRDMTTAVNERADLHGFPLFIVSLATCTGTDVIYVMNKKGVAFDEIWVNAFPERTEDIPKVAKKIDLHFIVIGDNLPRDVVERAIRMSQEKFCSISAMVKGVTEISTKLDILTKEEAIEKYPDMARSE